MRRSTAPKLHKIMQMMVASGAEACLEHTDFASCHKTLRLPSAVAGIHVRESEAMVLGGRGVVTGRILQQLVSSRVLL